MIGWLSGKVVQAVPDRLILDVGGVGYLVAIPLSTYYEIQKADAGAAIRLFIHTHVREDALALYGFWSEREKELFEQLIAVSGIGPRLAQVGRRRAGRVQGRARSGGRAVPAAAGCAAPDREPPAAARSG